MNISHPDKIWFPKSNLSKQDVINYYDKISKYFLFHSKQRLTVLQRYPDGINHDSFYQKQISNYFPQYLQTITIPLKKGGDQTMVVLSSKRSLLYLVGQATITFHTWMSTAQNYEKPNKIVFDLDPSSSSDLKELHQVALILKRTLEQYKLVPFIMTTGSKGYHIVVPIKPDYEFEFIHDFAKQIAQQLDAQYPNLITANSSISDRKEKIFIDYLRNAYGQTSVAPYSLRALEGAPVATPISWKSLRSSHPQKYNIQNIFTLLSKNQDAWKDFNKKRKKLVVPNKI